MLVIGELAKRWNSGLLFNVKDHNNATPTGSSIFPNGFSLYDANTRLSIDGDQFRSVTILFEV